jgi:23S rRNA pseudouridine2605 synthase
MENIAGEIRLNRYLAQCGLGSRRTCDDLISTGHIYINGERVRELGTKVNPDRDKVEFHGKEVRPISKLIYLAYNKPRGVVVTKNDPEGRETVFEALKKLNYDAEYLNYVGRLDFNSEGLLLLTNDGELIHSLTHPRFRIKKVYKVKVDRELRTEDIKKLIDGVESENQLLRAAAIRAIPDISDESRQFWYEIDLFEGKNRQIRRMMEALQINVSRLKRIQFASVKLGDLETDKARFLTEREIAALKNCGFKNSKAGG